MKEIKEEKHTHNNKPKQAHKQTKTNVMKETKKKEKSSVYLLHKVGHQVSDVHQAVLPALLLSQ